MVAEEVLKEESNLKFLKRQEFEYGQRPDGSLIGSYRSLGYMFDKERKNPLAGGNVDLILTGAFVESAYLLKPMDGSFLFGFKDRKTPKLMDQYNSGTSGQKNLKSLNQVTFDRVMDDIIRPRFMRKLKQRLNIGS